MTKRFSSTRDPLVSLHLQIVHTDWKRLRDTVAEGNTRNLQELARHWLKDVFEMSGTKDEVTKRFAAQEIAFLSAGFSWNFDEALKKDERSLLQRRESLVAFFLESSREKLQDLFSYLGVSSSASALQETHPD